MPIYEYECKKCGVVFEAMQSMSAKPLKTCMGLGCNDKDNGKVTRLISKSGFVLKGSGWYASDYPSDDRKKGWDEEGKQGKPDAPKPDGKEAPATASEASDSSAKTPPSAPAQSPAKPKGPKSPYSGKKKPKASSKAGKK
ncbi:MAG: FmdB family zinc ribbon protein [Nitrospinales bacterium]